MKKRLAILILCSAFAVGCGDLAQGPAGLEGGKGDWAGDYSEQRPQIVYQQCEGCAPVALPAQKVPCWPQVRTASPGSPLQITTYDIQVSVPAAQQMGTSELHIGTKRNPFEYGVEAAFELHYGNGDGNWTRVDPPGITLGYWRVFRLNQAFGTVSASWISAASDETLAAAGHARKSYSRVYKLSELGLQGCGDGCMLRVGLLPLSDLGKIDTEHYAVYFWASLR